MTYLTPRNADILTSNDITGIGEEILNARHNFFNEDISAKRVILRALFFEILFEKL